MISVQPSAPCVSTNESDAISLDDIHVCFLVYHYFLKTWYDSKQACTAANASLVNLVFGDLYDSFTDALVQRSLDGIDYWIGLSRNHWVWTSTGMYSGPSLFTFIELHKRFLGTYNLCDLTYLHYTFNSGNSWWWW